MNITRFVLIVCALLLLAAPVAAGKLATLCPFPADSPQVSTGNLCPLDTSSPGILPEYLCDPSFSTPPSFPSAPEMNYGSFPINSPITSPDSSVNTGEINQPTQTPLSPPGTSVNQDGGSSDAGSAAADNDIDPVSPDNGNADGSPVSPNAADPMGQPASGGISIVDDMANPQSLPGPVPLPGYFDPPTDPDNDGLFEDLNGNGSVDVEDVNLFYENLNWISANEPLELFDMDGNGIIEFSDMSAFSEV